MTNFGEHYNEELAQQEIEINKKASRNCICQTEHNCIYCRKTAKRQSPDRRQNNKRSDHLPQGLLIDLNFCWLFYCVCDLIF